MTSKNRVLRAAKSKIRSSAQLKKESSHSVINAWLMTFATLGLLSVATAQLYLFREQAKSAASIERLELAKAKPRVRITQSREVARYGGTEPGSYVELPNYFEIMLVSGIDSIFSIDTSIKLHVSDDNGATSCFIEVRGLFVQDEQRQRLNSLSPPTEDFAKLINALTGQGIEFNYPSWSFAVRYFDLYGDLNVDYLDLRLEPEPPVSNAWILYNGIWSDGVGFYSDEDSSKWCPNISDKLNSIISGLGGAPRNMGQLSENNERL